MPRKPNETIPTQFRLGPDDLARIDGLKVKYGLNSRADVVRMAVKVMVDLDIEPRHVTSPKKKAKSAKNPGKTP